MQQLKSTHLPQHGFKIISHFISHENLSEIVVLVFLQHQIKQGDL